MRRAATGQPAWPYQRRRSEALATLATITANGGITTATPATMIAASNEYRSITAQDSTNRPIAGRHQGEVPALIGPRGLRAGSVSWPITSPVPGYRPPKRGGPAGFRRARRGLAAAGLVMFITMFDEDAVLDGLNEQQRLAVTHQDGPLLVLARPAPGRRGRWWPGRRGSSAPGHCPASRILLLTFTRRAASDMLARASAGGQSAGGRIWGGTFHAIAHKIIRRHAESFSLSPQFTILDPGDTTDILDALRPDHGLAGTGQRTPRAAACADIYTRCVNTGRPVSEVVIAGYPWCAPFTSRLAGLFRAYTERKRARHLLDFDDLLLLWQAALADPASPARYCGACSTRCWWTSTRTSTRSRPASVGCSSRTASS